MKEPSDRRYERFREVILNARLFRGWSLREAAERIGVAHSRLDALERGRTWYTRHKEVSQETQPSYDMVLKIAAAHEIPAEQLLGLAGYGAVAELSEHERDVVAAYRRAEAADRASVDQLLGVSRSDPEDSAPVEG